MMTADAAPRHARPPVKTWAPGQGVDGTSATRSSSSSSRRRRGVQAHTNSPDQHATSSGTDTPLSQIHEDAADVGGAASEGWRFRGRASNSRGAEGRRTRRARRCAAVLVAVGIAACVPATAHAQVAGAAGALTLAPEGLAITAGGLVISDQAGNRVLQVSPTGETRVIAGTGAPDDFGGDGEPAVVARLARPGGLAVLQDGRLAIADRANGRVRVISSSGVISTLAGDGSNRADTTSANPTAIGDPFRIATLGGLLVYTTFRQLGVIRDGRAKLIPAPAQTLLAIAANAGGQLFVSDGKIIYIRGAGDTYTPFAGGGRATPGLGDGGPAGQATFSTLADLAFGPDGSLYVADTGNRRIRRIAPDGTVSTVAGGGGADLPSQGQVPAAALRLREPRAVVVAPNGDLFVADRAGGAVIRIDGNGMAARVAGCAGGLSCDPLDTNRAPERGQSEFAAPVSGTVLVRRPGTAAFVPLVRAQLLPDGSEYDTIKGVLDLTVSQSSKDFRTARVSRGQFIADQQPQRGGRTVLRLSGTALCAAARAAEPRAASRRKQRRKKRRSVFVDTAGGRFTTSSKHANASVRGTSWQTTERCASTTVGVRRGVVTVLDRVLRLTICVRAGRSYTAYAAPTAVQRRQARKRARGSCAGIPVKQ